MQVYLEGIENKSLSFSCKRYKQPFQNNSWHVHPEVEITYIKNGSGIRVIGDNFERLKNDELIILAANLPHLYKSDAELFEDLAVQPGEDEVISIHFNQNFWGKEMLELPEMKCIAELLHSSKNGLIINGQYKQQIVQKMEELLTLQLSQRIECLLNILLLLSLSIQDSVALASESFGKTYNLNHTERIRKIYDFTLANFKEDVAVKDMAELVAMTSHSFCRYFKASTTKTYWQFLIEIRIAYATRLLEQNNLSIAHICKKTGFNNLSNFNRHFKNITSITPKKYSKLFKTPVARKKKSLA